MDTIARPPTAPPAGTVLWAISYEDLGHGPLALNNGSIFGAYSARVRFVPYVVDVHGAAHLVTNEDHAKERAVNSHVADHIAVLIPTPDEFEAMRRTVAAQMSTSTLAELLSAR